MLNRLQMLAGVVILAFATTAFSQPGGQPGGPPMGGGPPMFFPPFEMPKPGQILAKTLQDQLKLTADQKKELAKMQKELDSQLEKLLTKEQMKSMQQPPPPKGGFGGGKGFGPPPMGFGPPPFGGMGGGGFGGGGFGPNRIDDVKKLIGATDEEWKVIGPMLQKVTAARRILTGDSGASVITQAQAELKTVLEDPKHAKTDVEEKLAAIRKTRQQARANLDAAQKDLRLLLTPAQEPILVGLGYLD